MIVTTTKSIEERGIAACHGIMGASVVRDLFAQVTEIAGRRSCASGGR
ncbi:hypothetical protein [Celeribacter indicus]|uniref:Uncharacterized protein n=1 Tax=Celeribacter indicus TaxID=1208324 RepID=A0A0B5DVM7_9RHOB|nr:hypothetical protein [Celeribacter indicus]AJE47064.1 hypothetical protein P73_2349 [Celeribacter indicus]SDW91811.1 hypothetical protein SAMN05443573_10987 [Celeribacter indicus]